MDLPTDIDLQTMKKGQIVPPTPDGLPALVPLEISNAQDDNVDEDVSLTDDSQLNRPPSHNSSSRSRLTLLKEHNPNVRVVGQKVSAEPKGWRAFIPSPRDVLSGVIGFVYALAMVMVSAGTVFSSERLRPHMGTLVYMYVLGCGVAGLILTFTSKLGYPIPNPDPFPIPFLVILVGIVEREVPEDEDHALVVNAVFILIVSHVLMGVILMLASTVRLMRFSDFIPYPVVCGLLAGQGGLLIKICVQLALDGMHEAPKIVLTSLFGLVFVFTRQRKPMFSIPGLFAVTIPIFYLILRSNKMSIAEAESQNWLFSHRAVAEAKVISTFTLDYSAIRFDILTACAPDLVAMLILFVIKTVLVYPGFEKLLNQKVHLDRELIACGIGCFGAGILGTAPSTLGPTVINLVYSISPTRHIPSVLGVILYNLSFALQVCAFVTYIPAFMLSGLLFANGYSLLNSWLVKPYRKLPLGEWVIILLIVVVSLVANLLLAIAIGAAISVVLFATSMSSVSCVKLVTTGRVVRSTVDRPTQHKDFLDENGDAIQIIQLQGYVFFGHGSMLINQIKHIKRTVRPFCGQPEEKRKKRMIPLEMLPQFINTTKRKIKQRRTKDEHDDNSNSGSDIEPSRNRPAIPPRKQPAQPRANSASSSTETQPKVDVRTRVLEILRLRKPAKPKVELLAPGARTTFMVFDLPFVLGMDTSAVDMFEQVLRVLGSECSVCFSGAQPHVKSILQRRKDIFSRVRVFPDLDAALEACEEELISPLVEEERRNAAKAYALADRAGGVDSLGFEKCLRKIGDRYGMDVSILRALRDYVTPIKLFAGDVLMNQRKGTAVDMKKDCLFFIEHGSIIIERDTEQSVSERTQEVVDEKTKRIQQRIQNRNFRLTRLGPGWILGAHELLSGYRSIGLFRAETDAIVHHMPFSSVRLIEQQNPQLGFELHYLLGKVITETSDRTKEQLSHVMDMIFTFPVASKPFSFGLSTTALNKIKLWK